MKKPMQLYVSVARYMPDSPLWEVCVWWGGSDASENLATTFGSENAARDFADKVQSAATKAVAGCFMDRRVS